MNFSGVIVSLTDTTLAIRLSCGSRVLILYVFSASFLGLLASIVIIGLFTDDHHSFRRRFIVQTIAFVVGLGSIYPVTDLRIKYNLNRLFDDNFRYAAFDIRGAIIENTNVYALNVFELSWDYTHIDACVEVYANLPTRMGGMSGYKWYRQYYDFADDFVPMDFFSIRDLWEPYDLEEGRCAAPNRQL